MRYLQPPFLGYAIYWTSVWLGWVMGGGGDISAILGPQPMPHTLWLHILCPLGATRKIVCLQTPQNLEPGAAEVVSLLYASLPWDPKKAGAM